MKGKSNHTKEFREKVAQEAISADNMNAVAEKYDLKPQTLYSWVKTFKNKEKTGVHGSQWINLQSNDLID